MPRPVVPLLSGLFLCVIGCGAPAGAPAVNAVAPADSSSVEATDMSQPADSSATSDDDVAAPREPAWRTEVTLEPKTWEETQKLIQSFAGKVVVVDVWSTACEPCLREFPNLVALQEKHGDNIVCIGLNCDYAGLRKRPPEYYRERVLKVLEDQQARIVNVMCTEPADELFAALKIDSIPAVFLYDRGGKLVATFDNRTNDNGEFTYADDVLPALQPLLP